MIIQLGQTKSTISSGVFALNQVENQEMLVVSFQTLVLVFGDIDNFQII